MLPDFLGILPYSTLFTFGLAFLISLFTTLLNRKFIDKEKFAKWREEINRWNADKNLAKRTADKRLMAKVKKQEPRILQMQSKMSFQQMKVFLITFIPLLIVWQVLIGFFANKPPVAYIPLLPENGPYGLPFFIWYLISNFFANTLLSRVFGVEMGMGLGQPKTK